MLSIIDKKLFPDKINVIELPDGRFVYQIHKNGSTTLEKIKIRSLSLNEIKQLDTVDIFVRDPYQRFLSGIKTYAFKLNVDIKELCKIVNDVYFLNNHFCPQLFWIINLHRFTNAKIRINHLDSLTSLTDINLNKQIGYNDLDIYFNNNNQLKHYLELDCVLYENFLNQTVEFSTIQTKIKENYSALYQDTFGYTKLIWNALD
tara:strand:+ start:4573 stop:5181 length:609 start_codon:yes stop_codon:yes gene_type:complete